MAKKISRNNEGYAFSSFVENATDAEEADVANQEVEDLEHEERESISAINADPEDENSTNNPEIDEGEMSTSQDGEPTGESSDETIGCLGNISNKMQDAADRLLKRKK